MKIKLRSILIENFKGIKSLDIDFADVTQVFGRNATGKTTIADAFFWLLFDKDSTGSSTFAIRPKDKDGVDIDNLEIKVEGTLDVDGEIITLTKTQKQKWTKHRGSTAPTFEGNVNIYEINSYPAKKSEYEQKIHSLIEESLFKLITNPRTFPSMKWQDQRKVLMEFVSEITDADILETDADKYGPIRADVLTAGADKAREKANAILKSLKKEQIEYPVRVDEASRNLSDGEEDRSNLVWQKGEAEEELSLIQNERNGLSKASKVVTDIQSEIMQKRRRMAEIERSAMLQDERKNLGATKAANDALMAIRKAENERDVLANKRAFLLAAIKENEKAKSELAGKYRECAAKTFPESDTICPTCKRPFEPERIEELRSNFEEDKKKQIEELNKKGFELKDKILTETEEVKQIEQQISGYTADIDGMNRKWEELKAEADKPVRTDPRTILQYQALQVQIDGLDQKLASLEDQSAVREDIERRESAAREKIDVINAALSRIDANERLMERIEQLKAEQRECGQKVANQEQIVYLLDEFVMAKMNLLSDRINAKFKKVRFKLWEQLINGGIKETCTMQINTNGSYVDYSDANNAAKIIGGLDVIEALSELYGVEAPIFLDNAEAIDSYNTPKTSAQLILLEVSDDETLHVEGM